MKVPEWAVRILVEDFYGSDVEYDHVFHGKRELAREGCITRMLNGVWDGVYRLGYADTNEWVEVDGWHYLDCWNDPEPDQTTTTDQQDTPYYPPAEGDEPVAGFPMNDAHMLATVEELYRLNTRYSHTVHLLVLKRHLQTLEQCLAIYGNHPGTSARVAELKKELESLESA